MKKRIWKNCMQALTAILFLLAVWGLVYCCVGNELLVPAFSDCLKECGKLFASALFWQGVFKTLLRVFAAFIISFLFALIFALVAYLLPSFRHFFVYIVVVLRTIPTLAVLLILLLWWGAGIAPVAVAFLSLFPLLYTGILAALLGVDNDLIEMSHVYGVSFKKQLLQLYFPVASPYVIREGSAALSFALKLVVSAEVLADTVKSLGGMMQDAKAYLDIPLLFALVLVTLVLGLLLEGVGSLFAEAIERRVR